MSATYFVDCFFFLLSFLVWRIMFMFFHRHIIILHQHFCLDVFSFDVFISFLSSSHSCLCFRRSAQNSRLANKGYSKYTTTAHNIDDHMKKYERKNRLCCSLFHSNRTMNDNEDFLLAYYYYYNYNKCNIKCYNSFSRNL